MLTGAVPRSAGHYSALEQRLAELGYVALGLTIPQAILVRADEVIQ